MKFSMSYRLVAFCFLLQNSCIFTVPDLIKELIITQNKLQVVAEEAFHNDFLNSHFFAEYEDIDLTKLNYSIVTIPFVLNVISIIWISGRLYSIEEMDEDLYYALARVKEIFTIMYPKTCWSGKLIPKKLVKHAIKPGPWSSGTALFFTGGLDSVSTCFRYYPQKQLLISVAGASDLSSLSSIEEKERFRSFSRTYGHENAFISSNPWFFINTAKVETISPEIRSWRYNAVENMSWIGLAAPVLVTNGCPLVRIASTITADMPYPFAGIPLVDDVLSYAGVHVQHDAFELNRSQKAAIIENVCTKHGLERPRVKVCQHLIDANCCRCGKCLHTINAFMIAGIPHQAYGFDISAEDARNRTKALLDTLQWSSGFFDPFPLLYFLPLQKTLTRRLEAGENLDEYFRWLSKKQLHYPILCDWRAIFDAVKMLDSLIPDHIALQYQAMLSLT